jgi:hypothetical protein
MSFPGPQKNKMEFFIHRLYDGRHGQQLTKDTLMPKVEAFAFAPDVQVFFEELPDGSYDEPGLVRALNTVITRRGRADAIGGTLAVLDTVPQGWEEAYQEEYAKR